MTIWENSVKLSNGRAWLYFEYLKACSFIPGQRITIWKPFTIQSSFQFKPAIISRLAGRDFVDCRKVEILTVKDKDKNGKDFVHEIKRKEYDDYCHYQVIGSKQNMLHNF